MRKVTNHQLLLEELEPVSVLKEVILLVEGVIKPQAMHKDLLKHTLVSNQMMLPTRRIKNMPKIRICY